MQQNAPGVEFLPTGQRVGSGTLEASERVMLTAVHFHEASADHPEDDETVAHHATRVGFYAASAGFIAAAGFSVVQVLQLVGAFSTPLDGILIYGFSLGIATPFLLALLGLHYAMPARKKLWSHAAVLFAVIYAVYVSLNYVVQLATVIPATLRGGLDDLRILDQTPHSLFWDIDALGYIFMGLATACASLVFTRSRRERWVKWFMLANGLITPVIALVYFYPRFSVGLLIVATPWLVTAPGSLLALALYFRARTRDERGLLEGRLHRASDDVVRR